MENLVNEEKAIADVDEALFASPLGTKQKAMLIGGVTLIAGAAVVIGYFLTKKKKGEWLQVQGKPEIQTSNPEQK